MRKLKRLFIVVLSLVLSLNTVHISAATYQKMEITMIDVGAGDSFYIEMPNGDDILIDGGLYSNGTKIVEMLNKREKNMTLEAVISTHPDADHVAGLSKIFKKMKVKNFYYPSDISYSKTETAKEVMSLAKKESGCKLVKAKPGTKIKGGDGAYLKFFQNDIDYETTNEDSLMCYIKYNKLDILLTGDAENGSEYKGLEKVNMDIVQAPHHGSSGSSSSSFIKKFDPEHVLISTDGEKYGHPHDATLKRYKKYDSKIKVYRTDKLGNVTIKSNGKTWSFSDKGETIKLRSTSNSNSSNDTNKGNGASSDITDKNSTIVFTTKTGKKYHSTKKCSGLSNANAIYESKLNDAKNKGLTPCAKCY